MIRAGPNLILSNFIKSEQKLTRLKLFQPFLIDQCFVNTVPDTVLEKARHSKLGLAVKGAGVQESKKATTKKPDVKEKQQFIEAIRDYKYIYPDFLPNPVFYFRDKIKEKLEREDMIERRKQISIPEFYVGSILAVNVSDAYAPGKTNRFVGICIRRDGYQLKHTFTLRNVIDGQGVELEYDLYNPTIQSIEVLKLEKRLDESLTYLQDCPPEYSTVPFDMQPVKSPPGITVPLNTIKVPLKSKPWRHKWDRRDLKGVIYPNMKRVEYAKYIKSNNDFKPFEKWDMMKHYRESIHDDDTKEVVEDLKKLEKEVETKTEIVVSSKKLQKTRRIPQETSILQKK